MDSRELAYRILFGVICLGKSLKKELSLYSKEISRLSARNKKLLNELVKGVLKNYVILKELAKPYLAKRTEEDALIIISLGLYQLISMDRIPSYAVVNEMVNVAKGIGKDYYAPFINKILRKASGERDVLVEEFHRMLEEKKRKLLPNWVIEKIDGMVDIDRYLKNFLMDPPVVIRVNNLKTTRGEFIRTLKKYGLECQETRYSPYGIILKEGFPGNIPGFADGLFFVQDESSQLISMLLKPISGDRIIDVGAFPGGKTMALSMLSDGRAEIWAIDPDKNRERLFRENLKRVGIKGIKILTMDFVEFSKKLVYHKGLLDAPCSSLGIVGRQPDILFTRKEEDIEKYREKQIKLLKKLIFTVKKGGEIVYSVCTLTHDETWDVVEAVEKEGKVARLDIGEEFPSLRDMVKDGVLITLPPDESYYMDIQFAIKWRKVDGR